MRCLLYRNKAVKRVNLNIDPRADLRDILQNLEEIYLPPEQAEQWVPAHIRYALVELIRNSQEAQQRRGESRPIRIVLEAAGPWEADDSRLNPRGLPGLRAEVEDAGGGISPEELPYPLDTPINEIDPQAPELTAYREQWNYRRFGLGLYTVRRTFPGFSLETIEAGKSRGTRVRLFLPEEIQP